MKAYLILFLLCLGGSALAQGDLIRVRSGHSFEEEFPRNIRYRFSTFQPGKIMYVSGKTSPVHRFNYDILFEGILSIQPTGDTIVLADRSDFKYFFIKDAIYYRTAKDKYIEIFVFTDSAKLAMRETFIIKRRDKRVNDSYNTFVDNTNSVRSTTNMGYGRMIYDQDLLMAKAIYYFVVDKHGNVFKASKSKFLKVFPGHKAAIKSYIDRNFIDFRSRNDLTKLFDYCTRL